MTTELHSYQANQGAVFSPEGIPLDFGIAPATVWQAAYGGVAICDRSHWGLLTLTGEDRQRFLHNQTTQSWQLRSPGQGGETVFVTSTARTLDLAMVWVKSDALWLLVSPPCRTQLYEWMDRFIFPMDKVAVSDRTGDYAIFQVMGPRSGAIAEALGLPLPPEQAGHHCPLGEEGVIAQGNGLGLPGYTLMVPWASAGAMWEQWCAAGAIPCGEDLWQQLRITQGRPWPGRELTADYNPLEAGLWHTLAFDKGCYIGQETIARLNTYKGVKQRLWGLVSDRPLQADIPLLLHGEKVGVVTSAIGTPEGDRGLGYVRTKVGGEDLELTAGEATVKTVALAYIQHTYHEPTAPKP